MSDKLHEPRSLAPKSNAGRTAAAGCKPRRGISFALLGFLLIGGLGACSAGDGTGDAPETTGGNGPGADAEPGVEEVYAGSAGVGEEGPEVVISASRSDLPRRPELDELTAFDTSDSGETVYIAAFAGLKTTGGHSVSIREVSRTGDLVEIVVRETAPPEGARVAQALTYPAAVVSVRGIEREELPGLDFSAVNPAGKELGWPVRISGG
ncbi:protease complex subunit PrcB family protein [Rubrobacter indicoceani]|uniref:protease complex subunit PrcB family protein n=1 Tax=Rubrobacter indicoceani TaxID=2051957 RepID=UPI0013C510F3|nr:protease complex subunit PrcB family protein [Rubrobacter indicoceani]